MDENTQPKTETETEAKTESETGSCCGSSASKPKDVSKYDYRHKTHGEAATRRKGCC